ncbi:DoxX family membrane protein [bacterium]|nr:DoxX family membrane protein [bacterium]HPF35290.1 MauE/DoxX family redox-associated membrane protein [Candidatus Krumholzibacteria bacterium]HRX50489.1 MauE/DoxX family redox-associated membrane protein [Candidatus Krumholzibacteria bacterium]
MTNATPVRGLILPDWLELIVRFLVGGTFVYASVDKILHPDAFAQAIFHYRMLPPALLHPTALVLPWLELVAGLAMILGFWRRAAAFWISVMLVVFMVAIASALSRGLDISCGCFHTEAGHAVGLSLLFRDVALLAGAVVLWAARGVRRTL